MKTVAQWAEQLPELIKIEFLKEAENQKTDIDAVLDINYSGFSQSLFFHIAEIDKWFWYGLRDNEYVNPTSADYLDETIPYTKEEVESMIFEFADPNDKLCQLMLEFIGAGESIGIIGEDKSEIVFSYNADRDTALAKELAEEKEALKSTIQGLNAIVETQKVEIERLMQNGVTQRNTIEKALSRIDELLRINNDYNKPTLLERIKNWPFK